MKQQIAGFILWLVFYGLLGCVLGCAVSVDSAPPREEVDAGPSRPERVCRQTAGNVVPCCTSDMATEELAADCQILEHGLPFVGWPMHCAPYEGCEAKEYLASTPADPKHTYLWCCP